MSEQSPDKPAAFPIVALPFINEAGENKNGFINVGVSLRAYIASQQLAALALAYGTLQATDDELCVVAIRLADALIARLEAK